MMILKLDYVNSWQISKMFAQRPAALLSGGKLKTSNNKNTLIFKLKTIWTKTKQYRH